MKTKFFLFSVLFLSASLAKAQAPSGGASPPSSPGGAASSRGSQTGQRQITPGGQRSVIQGQQQPGQNGVNVGTNNRPNGIGANQPNDPDRQRVLLPNQNPVFGGTNQVTFGTTNRPFGATNGAAFGGTNRSGFGATNQVAFDPTNGATPFSTNRAPSPIAGGSVINEASGAAANQNGALLPPVDANGNVTGQTTVNGQIPNSTGGESDEVFNQRLRAALLQTGATKIYFPQTRSSVMVANQNGTVILTGFVASEAEKRDIEAKIRKTQGVLNVQNRLQASASGTAPGTNQPATQIGDPRLRTP